MTTETALPSLDERPAVQPDELCPEEPPPATGESAGNPLPLDTPDDNDGAILLELADEEDLGEPVASRLSWPAVLAAAVLHAWLIAALAVITLDREPIVYEMPIDGRMEPSETPEKPEKVVDYELSIPNDEDLPVREALNAASVGASKTKQPRPESQPHLLTEVEVESRRLPMYDIPEGIEIDERLVVKGSHGDSVLQIESALDRVTWEIARNMRESKVLVVWLLDASGSLQKQREVIAGRLDRIYGELGALEDVGQIPRRRNPLLSGVVTFGERTEFLTPEPSDKFEDVRTAIESVQPDPSGKENVFTAVHRVMQRWHGYRTSGGRRMMLVIVTDETGDDFPMHVPAINLCRRHGAMAYVIGPTAVFGRRKGYVPYVAPEDGNTYRLQVDLGPETAMFDLVDLPFWYGGPQYKYLSAGVGPYALSRLVRETGGMYFTTKMTTMEGLAPVGYFDPGTLKPFEPDYRFGTKQQYLAHLRNHRLRLAVVKASQVSRENQAGGTPRLQLRVTPGNFRQAATEAQETVAKSRLMIDTILAAFPPDVEELYQRESSLRWRMAFNLAYGRLLAGRVRCLEYNTALAALKGDLTPEDVGSRANQWIFKPSEELNYATHLKSQAKEARRLLERVLDEAPDTPWAVLAARELQNPLGIRVVFRYIPPPKQRPAESRPNNNNRPPPARLLLADDNRRPPPAPKPPKKKKVVLPKL